MLLFPTSEWSGLLLLLFALSICSVSPWSGYHHLIVEEHLGDYYEGGAPQGYGPYDQNGCSCQLFAESSMVFEKVNTSVWHSCSGRGLYRCGRYCDDLVQDEGMRYRSRQNACDTLGRAEVNTPWYRRHQVCDVYGPYEDILMQEDLCCKSGRPSDNC